jgi:hypothetical protein
VPTASCLHLGQHCQRRIVCTLEHHVQGSRTILRGCRRHRTHLDNASIVDHNIDVLKALCGCVWLTKNVYIEVQVLYQDLKSFARTRVAWQGPVLLRGVRPARSASCLAEIDCIPDSVLDQRDVLRLHS